MIQSRKALMTLSLVSVAIGLFAWQMAAIQIEDPILVPSFTQSAAALLNGFADGTVATNLMVTLGRVLAGFILGLAIGTPLGLVMGQFPVVRWFLAPYVNFFRFVTPVALLTLIIIWAGSGEQSKVILIAYVSGFILLQSALRGVLDIEPVVTRAGRMLGTGHAQAFWHITVPASLGAIFIGARTAFGYAFMTVIAAEIIVNDSGIGYMIWTSQLYSQTEFVFASLIMLGIIGLVFDLIFASAARRFTMRLATR